MNVQQLINELQKHPRDMEVVVDGYEGGYNKLSEVGILTITREPVNTVSWYGSYDQDDDGQKVVYFPQ